MYSPQPTSFAYCTTSFTGNPIVSPGAAVTMGFSNTPGTAVALIGTPLTHDVEMLEVIVGCATATTKQSTVDTSAMIDILIDPAGGTSWDTTNILIEGLFAGFMNLSDANSSLIGGRRWNFPLWLPAGATLAARGQSVVASGGVQVEVSVNAFGGVNDPGRYWCGQKVDAVGINKASSKGTTLAPSVTANTFGSWTSIGSATTRRYGCLIPSACVSSGAVGSGTWQFEVGYSSTRLGRQFHHLTGSTEGCSDFIEDKRIFAEVVEGTQLQARVRTNASQSNMQMIIHGVA